MAKQRKSTPKAPDKDNPAPKTQAANTPEDPKEQARKEAVAFWRYYWIVKGGQASETKAQAKTTADKPGLDAPAAAVVTQDETDFLPVSEVADVCGKSKGRISQLCTEGKIACRGKGPQRTVSLVSAQAHFAKTAKNRISKANATLARDARRDTRELERDRV